MDREKKRELLKSMSNTDDKRERNGELKEIVVKFRLKVQISFC
jgi:hypothetical protein